MSNQHNPSKDVITYGTISLDNIIRLPAMATPQNPAQVTADYYRLGGGALNVALPLAVWGHSVRVVGNQLGEDAYADYIFSELERYPAVDRRFLERDERVRTPFCRIFMTPNEERHVLGYWFDETPKVALTAEMVAGARLLSTDVYGETARVEAARVAKAAGLLVVSSNVVWAEHDLLYLSDWVIISRGFLRIKFPDVDPQEHLHELHRRHQAIFVMTDGPNATRILTQNGKWLTVPTYSLPPLDRVSAGDVFKAGLIHAILADMPLIESVRFANAAAALWISQPAALKRPPTLEEIRELQEERGVLRRWVPLGYGRQKTACPICRRVVATPLFEKHWQLDRRLVRVLRTQHPAWQRVQGACPSCVHEMVPQVGLTRTTAPSQPPAVLGGELFSLATHPIYGQVEPAALPTGIRLRANPHYQGRGVTIAFLDSGFYPHRDLTKPENRILSFVDASTDEILVDADFSKPALTSWHGLMTSVVAAGNGYLSQGYYAGLARASKLLLIKVSDPQMRIWERDILRGLRWLAKHWREYGVKVLNLSIGGDPGLRPNSELNQLVNQLVEEGLVIVAAAGNSGQNDLCPPASASLAITVGGLDDANTLDDSDNRIWHSNWGHIAPDSLKPELIAPSIWLAAPVLPGTSVAEQNLILERLRRAKDRELPNMLAARLFDLDFDASLLGQPIEVIRRAVFAKLVENKFISSFYQHVDGTSFATPIVSSVVAQMLEANPNLTPKRIKELLIATARPLPNVPDYKQGYGVVMPGLAVAAALREFYGRYKPGNLSPKISTDRIRFTFYEPHAKSVSIIGQWNDWNPECQPMSQGKPGIWEADMARLPAGHYDYKFLIDGERWLDDPENLNKTVDGYGGFNAVLEV